MAIIKWSEELNVGIKQIDSQHQQLISIINTLHDHMMQRKGKDVLKTIVDQLADYTRKHFTTEEQLFIKHKYSEATGHKHQHDAFIEKVAGYQNELQKGSNMFSVDVLNFLRDWITNHIKVTDKKYAPFLRAKGVA
ncbi:MAG: bacteriohemerythrin [Desulfobacteraceae bacterium]|nr:bacteriohemerythrin [Desulfobacteraceae bacterium]